MNKELKENIMQGTLQAFNQKGLKFTMDDIMEIGLQGKADSGKKQIVGIFVTIT